MKIENTQTDPVEFVIANERELVLSLETWNSKTLHLLLKKHNLTTSGSKRHKILRILDAIKLGEITLDNLQEWFFRYLREGNRHIYLYDIIVQHTNALKGLEQFKQLLREKGLQKTNLLYQDVADGLVYFDYTELDQEVQTISFAYKEAKVVKVPDYETDTIDSRTIDYNIFVDIDLSGNTMMINLDPLSGMREVNDVDERVSIQKIAERYKNIVGLSLNLRFEDSHEITQQALYQIWKDATEFDLPGVKQLVSDITSSVEEFVTFLCSPEKLDLNDESKTTLTKRILSSVEHAIIREKYDDLEELISESRENRPGFITEHNVRERTGSTLRQKSADRETPIEEADAFGDTKITIDQLERVQKLHYTWHGILDITPNEIPTIIENAGFHFDQIIFTRHSTLEEINHVVSEFKRYKNNIRSSRGGRG